MRVFNRGDPKYKYFWGAVHIEYVTMAVSFLALLFIDHAIVFLALASAFISFFAGCAFFASVYVAVLLGIRFSKPQFFLPCLFCQGLFLAYRFVYFLLFLVGSSWNYKVMEDPHISYMIIASLFQICAFDIFMNCYKYYCDKAAAKNRSLPKTISSVPKEVEVSL